MPPQCPSRGTGGWRAPQRSWLPRSCKERKTHQCILASGFDPGTWGPLGMRSSDPARVPHSCSACHPPHSASHSHSKRRGSLVFFCDWHRRGQVADRAGGQRVDGVGGFSEPTLSQECQRLPGSVVHGGWGPSLWVYHISNLSPKLVTCSHPSERPSRTGCGFSSSSSSSRVISQQCKEGMCLLHRDVLQPQGTLTSVGCGSQSCGR